MKSGYTIIAAVMLLAIMSVTSAHAGSTGKIIGKVLDDAGQPVPGITILVVGTTRGAATDPDGKYSIIGVPIGTYSVQASGVGYNPQQFNQVKVGADETTSLNFTLTGDAVKMQIVEITAESQLVNSLSVSSTQNVSQKSIEGLPNVKSVDDVLKLQAGFVKQGNNLFLRGGRANEVQYLVDGIPTNNVSGSGAASTAGTNEELQKFYQGNANGSIGGGGGGLSISANAIQSVSVQTSGFDADLGNAQSGVINITTKSGGSERYAASAHYRSDKISAANQNERFMSFSFGGPEPITKFVLPALGLKIPGNLTFFFNTDINRADGANTYVQNQFFHPLEREIHLKGLLGGVLDGLGFKFTDLQSNSFTFNSKVRYDMSQSDQIQYSYNASLSTTHGYNQFWKYRADSSQLGAADAVTQTLAWTHFFSTNTFLRLNFGKVTNDNGNDVAGIKPNEYSDAWQLRDPNDNGFYDLGTTQTWFHAVTNVWTGKLDFNSQVHPLHLLKVGFEFNYESLVSTQIERPTVASTDSAGNTILPPFPAYKNRDRGEYPGYGVYRWATNSYPNRGAAYLQDNIEFSGLNLHVGLRYDYFDIGKQVYDEEWVNEWKLAVLYNPNDPNSLSPDWVDHQVNGSSFLYYASHGYVSPRLAIGYPVTDRIVFYFNYGHFLQFPDRNQYYQDPFGQGPKLNLVGNPNLKPQRTVQYEAGFKDQFSDDMAFSVAAFYKDIFDYPTTVARGDNQVFINFDYASVRGFEFTFKQAFSGNFSVDASYAYQLAKGRTSNPLAAALNPEFQLPRETRLDYDQNHTVNLYARYGVGANEPGTLFGLPFFNNYSMSFTWSYGSGFPYTPFRLRTTARNQYLVNGETKPYTSTANFSFAKGFSLTDRMTISLTLDVTNLFNRRNVVAVFDYTGAPVKYGDVYQGDPTTIYPYRAWEYRDDPTNFDVGRQVLAGIKLSWD